MSDSLKPKAQSPKPSPKAQSPKPSPLPADYHIHTAWCGHASGSMEEYVLRAIELGLPEMGFSEHLPQPVPIPDKVAPTADEMEQFIDEFASLRKAYAGRMTIRLGGEADFTPGSAQAIERMKRDYGLEYVIGSVHFLGGWALDHPAYQDGFAARSVDAAYGEYFEMIREAAGTGLFDVIGHLDLPKKFGHRPDTSVVKLAEKSIEAMAANGVGFEINTAGRDKPVGEFYPSRELIVACREAGLRLTFGSDSHRPTEVGRYFREASELARECGYKHTMRMSPGREAAEI